jgi:hypothetical protein
MVQKDNRLDKCGCRLIDSATRKIVRIWRVYTVGIQDIAQGYDPFQLVHISPANYRENFELVFAHALERQIQPLVGVDVGKNGLAQELSQLLLVWPFRRLARKRREVD